MNRAERRALAKQVAAGGVDLTPQVQQPEPPLVLTFGYCHGPFWHALWGQSVLACASRSVQLGFALRPRPVETGPQLDKARNLIVKNFLEGSDPYLLFSDTDTVFTPEDIALLLRADAPIAGALYFTAATGMDPWPVALRWDDDQDAYAPITLPEVPPVPRPEEFGDEGQEDYAAAMAEWDRAVTALGDPIKVDAVGCGLMLIKREVVEDVADTYRFPFEYADGRGEDITFCLRAAEMGHDTYLVPAARIGHVKTTVL